MIRRHHQATPFVAGSDQLEQDGCLSLILPHVAKVVEDQQMVFVELVDRALQRQRLSGLLQALHQIDRSGEQDAVAALDEGMTQSSTEMRLPRPARAEQQAAQDARSAAKSEA